MIDAKLKGSLLHDIYHSGTFHEYDRRNGYGQPWLYWYEDERGTLVHSFMMRPIERVGALAVREDLFDIETIKGLGGPLASTTQPEFLKDAWREYGQWCSQNHIVAEYVRFNPFVSNADVGAQFFELSDSPRLGVALDLSRSEDEIWKTQYDINQRNMVRKAERLGVSCALDDGDEAFECFIKLQHDEWVRQQVRADRHFPTESLWFLRKSFGAAHRLFTAQLAGQTIVAAIFLIHNDIIHHQFLARNPAFGSSGASNYLLHSVAQWAKNQGMKFLHFGAGRTSNPHDMLLRFKRTLSKDRVSYPVGFKCHNPKVFIELCDLWKRQTDAELPVHSMPYREPLPLDIPEVAT